MHEAAVLVEHVVSEEPGHCPECGMKLLAGEAPATTYTCPMHPEIVTWEPGRCPECGMKLLASQLVAEASGGHEHEGHDHEHRAHGHEADAHGHEAAGGIEWDDDMVEVNRMTTPANMRWKLIDRATGDENAAIDWRFRVGDQVKIRLLNEMAGDHPMHHPLHVHGAGRFLVLSRDGVVEPNLVWKDTVLVRSGETVDTCWTSPTSACGWPIATSPSTRERHDVQLRGRRVADGAPMRAAAGMGAYRAPPDCLDHGWSRTGVACWPAPRAVSGP